MIEGKKCRYSKFFHLIIPLSVGIEMKSNQNPKCWDFSVYTMLSHIATLLCTFYSCYICYSYCDKNTSNNFFKKALWKRPKQLKFSVKWNFKWKISWNMLVLNRKWITEIHWLDDVFPEDVYFYLFLKLYTFFGYTTQFMRF